MTIKRLFLPIYILAILSFTACGNVTPKQEKLPDGSELPTNELVGNQETCQRMSDDPENTSGFVKMQNDDGSFDTVYIVNGKVYEKFNDEFFVYNNSLVVLDQCLFKTDHNGQLPAAN